MARSLGQVSRLSDHELAKLRKQQQRQQANDNHKTAIGTEVRREGSEQEWEWEWESYELGALALQLAHETEQAAQRDRSSDRNSDNNRNSGSNRGRREMRPLGYFTPAGIVNRHTDTR